MQPIGLQDFSLVFTHKLQVWYFGLGKVCVFRDDNFGEIFGRNNPNTICFVFELSSA